METVIKADIFFIVTTAAVVILSLLAIVVFVYIIRILRNIFYISKLARKQGDETAQDISEFRQSLRKEISEFKERAHSEGEDVMVSFSSAHNAVKSDVKRFWGLFTSVLSFFTIEGLLKVFNRNNNDKKRDHGKKSKSKKR